MGELHELDSHISFCKHRAQVLTFLPALLSLAFRERGARAPSSHFFLWTFYKARENGNASEQLRIVANVVVRVRSHGRDDDLRQR
jgi:hypothetical protein